MRSVERPVLFNLPRAGRPGANTAAHPHHHTKPHCLAAAPNRDAHSDPDPHADVDSRAQLDPHPVPSVGRLAHRAPHTDVYAYAKTVILTNAW